MKHSWQVRAWKLLARNKMRSGRWQVAAVARQVEVSERSIYRLIRKGRIDNAELIRHEMNS